MNAWNVNCFFLLLPIETDFSPIIALWAYWDFSLGPQLGLKSILYGKILYVPSILLQCSVPEGDLHCQCILSIFPASEHQFYVNILVFVNINPFLYINNQFALGYVQYSQIIKKIWQSLKQSTSYSSSDKIWLFWPWVTMLQCSVPEAKGTCIVNAYCQFSQQVSTNFM